MKKKFALQKTYIFFIFVLLVYTKSQQLNKKGNAFQSELERLQQSHMRLLENQDNQNANQDNNGKQKNEKQGNQQTTNILKSQNSNPILSGNNVGAPQTCGQGTANTPPCPPQAALSTGAIVAFVVIPAGLILIIVIVACKYCCKNPQIQENKNTQNQAGTEQVLPEPAQGSNMVN